MSRQLNTARCSSALERQRRRAGLSLIAPGGVAVILFTLLPLALAAVFSFTKYDLINPPEWVGFDNYIGLFSDQVFLQAIGNTLYFAFGQVAIGVVVAFMIAMLFSQKLHGNSVMRTIVYMPQAMSYVIVALFWSFFFDPFSGPINEFLQHLGMPKVYFLTEASTAMPSILLVSLWRNMGYYMVILLAGIQAIPPQLIEAAQIDGAGAFRRLIYVVIPQLKNTLFFVAITWLMGGFQMFTQAYVMTQGGPENSTRTIVYELYESAFTYLDIGRACAIAVLLFSTVIVVGLPVRLFQNRAARRSATPERTLEHSGGTR